MHVNKGTVHDVVGKLGHIVMRDETPFLERRVAGGRGDDDIHHGRVAREERQSSTITWLFLMERLQLTDCPAAR